MKKRILSISLVIVLAALTASCVPAVTVPNPSSTVVSAPVTPPTGTSLMPSTVTPPAETSTAPSSQIVLQTISFAPDFTSPLRNPERGFFEGFGLEETSLDWYVELGYTLAYTEAGDLRAYIHRDLPPEYLQRLNAHFQLARRDLQPQPAALRLRNRPARDEIAALERHRSGLSSGSNSRLEGTGLL